MPTYTLADHERDIAIARERAKVVVAWRRINAVLPVEVQPADRRLLRKAGVLLPRKGEVWASDAAALARSPRQMLDVLRSLTKK
jgi:hypothetical protein